MGYAVVFLIISMLILIHELGHFVAAKTAGIRVQVFSIGFGPRIFGFTYGGTEYRFSAIPIGGYVMPEMAELEDYFKLSFRKRVVFALAGPLANVIAAYTGLVVMCVLQNGITVESVFVLPFLQLYDITVQFVGSIPALISQPRQLSGIVGIVAYGKEIGVDVIRLLTLSVLLNINLAFLNLLPVLPFDGGKVLVDLLDKLKLPVKRLYVPVAVAGWAVILLLMVYVTVNDIHKFFVMA